MEFEKNHKNTLTEDEKRMFDALRAVANFWWARFDNRVSLNWKVSLSLWGVLVGYIGIALNGRTAFPISGFSTVAVFVVGFLIAYVHYRYVMGSTKSHEIDRNMFNEYEQRYMEIIEHQHGEDVKKGIAKAKLKQTSITHWANNFFLLITIILVLIAIVLTIHMDKNASFKLCLSGMEGILT